MRFPKSARTPLRNFARPVSRVTQVTAIVPHQTAFDNLNENQVVIATGSFGSGGVSLDGAQPLAGVCGKGPKTCSKSNQLR